MKDNSIVDFKENYKIDMDENGMAFIQHHFKLEDEGIDSLTHLKYFSQLLLDLLLQEDVNAVSFVVPKVSSNKVYRELIELHANPTSSDILKDIYDDIIALKKSTKPLIALITESCQNLSLLTSFWANARFAFSTISLSCTDSKFGIFAGFGIQAAIPTRCDTKFSLDFLIKQKRILADEAVQIGLINGQGQDLLSILEMAKSYCIVHDSANLRLDRMFDLDENQIDEAASFIRKSERKLPKGLAYALEIIRFSHETYLEHILNKEYELYRKLWKDPITTAYLRIHYFAVNNAIQRAKSVVLTNFELKSLGIIGAGMMGAGIAYEAAKASVKVILKDSTLERAELGKNYSFQVSNKLIQQGRMSLGKQSDLLACIIPTASTQDFEDVDLIIEAVNEDKVLKALVSKESAVYINKTGFFASNTTSLPISKLAEAIDDPSRFIGMHFFSPVDRMALVEIIKGKNTSEETVNKSLFVAAKLGKIPIVVNDGPAFFTSRIFFNYLLEGITMLMEGIDPFLIEAQAKVAGFGASPLAVLDEISLPLMLQVYDQLPEMHAGQRKAYIFLKEMIQEGRLGRKSMTGFYSYTQERKEIWYNPKLTVDKVVEPNHIQKRLLHVIALDSYRCLEDGIIENSIDADLGSILGLGYPALSGGVFSHIDLTGIQSFVQECKTFEPFGEQWTIPNSLIRLADENFRFYSGIDSN